MLAGLNAAAGLLVNPINAADAGNAPSTMAKPPHRSKAAASPSPSSGVLPRKYNATANKPQCTMSRHSSNGFMLSGPGAGMWALPCAMARKTEYA
jgi:hypothetical protein